MSNPITTKDGATDLRAIDKADIIIELLGATGVSGVSPIGIAKTFTFNVNKPKTPIYVLSRRLPAGYTSDPEDKTFTMNELFTYNYLDHVSFFLEPEANGITGGFEIQIKVAEKSDQEGTSIGASQKIITLKEVTFESASINIDSNTSEYTFDFTGRYTKGVADGKDF